VEDGRLASDVRRLRESLPGFAEPAAPPCFVVNSGLPGSGKTYFSRRLAERIPVTVLESDTLRRVLSPSPDHGSRESARLFRAIHALAEELLASGRSLVLDATNLTERFRRHLYAIADHTGARLVIVLIEAPPEVIRRRLATRTGDADNRSDADWDVYQRMRAEVAPIGRRHLVVDGSGDISAAIDRVVREVAG